jgi:hypothetical protein
MIKFILPMGRRLNCYGRHPPDRKSLVLGQTYGEPRKERRRELRLLLSLPLSRTSDVICAFYEIERAELSHCGGRHPARAALAYLARSRTMATNAELATLLGLSRAESVPNLTRRLAAWLASDGKVRKQLRGLEEELDESG